MNLLCPRLTSNLSYFGWQVYYGIWVPTNPYVIPYSFAYRMNIHYRLLLFGLEHSCLHKFSDGYVLNLLLFDYPWTKSYFANSLIMIFIASKGWKCNTYKHKCKHTRYKKGSFTVNMMQLICLFWCSVPKMCRYPQMHVANQS